MGDTETRYHVSIDVDDEPVLDLVLHRSRLGEIVACIGTRGNLLELADARRGFADVHVATCVRPGRPEAAGHAGECIALPFAAQSEFVARMSRRGARNATRLRLRGSFPDVASLIRATSSS